jgi:RNA polymerase sigma-70 factor (ECF subfamily)
MKPEKIEIENLYVNCYERLYAIALLMLKDEDEARDAVSSIFTKTADGSLSLPAERRESYLLVAVRNKCLDRIRQLSLRERVERRLSLAEPSVTPVETDLEQAAEIIAYAERTLPKQTWQVFQLRFDKGLLYREIAEQLGISEVAVYKHLALALRKLKEKYNPNRI